MTLYEQELQKMIRGIPFIQRYTLAGKAILGSLDKDLRFKISFVTTGIAGHYDALKIRVINRTVGEVDGQIIKAIPHKKRKQNNAECDIIKA